MPRPPSPLPPNITPALLLNFTLMASSYAFVAISAAIARELGLQAWHMGIIISIVGLLCVLTAKYWGRQSDKKGRIAVMLTCLSGFSIFYLLLASFIGWALHAKSVSAAAPSVGLTVLFMILTRGGIGIFYAGLPVASTAWIADQSESGQRTALMAKLGAAGAIGMVVAPPVAGWIAQHNLTYVLFIFALLPLISFPSLYQLRHSPVISHQTTVPLKIAVHDSRIRFAWYSYFILFSTVIITNICLGFFLIDILQVATEQASSVVGYAMSTAGVGLIIIQTLVSRLPHISALQWLRWGALFGLTGFGSTLLIPAQSPLWVCISYLLAGLGLGAAFPSVSAMAADNVNSKEQGACAGTMATAQGVSLVAAPFTGTLLYDLHPFIPYFLVMTALAAIFVLSWITDNPAERTAS